MPKLEYNFQENILELITTPGLETSESTFNPVKLIVAEGEPASGVGGHYIKLSIFDDAGNFIDDFYSNVDELTGDQILYETDSPDDSLLNVAGSDAYITPSEYQTYAALIEELYDINNAQIVADTSCTGGDSADSGFGECISLTLCIDTFTEIYNDAENLCNSLNIGSSDPEVIGPWDYGDALSDLTTHSVWVDLNIAVPMASDAISTDQYCFEQFPDYDTSEIYSITTLDEEVVSTFLGRLGWLSARSITRR